jgi:DNA-binding response OmpR family regulator
MCPWRSRGNPRCGWRLENPPDAIILDVDLPDTDGYTLCRAMRRTSTLRTVPIVMLTALSDKRNEIAGLRAGADDYLTKPIDTERLQARLENALSRNIRELDANPLTHLPETRVFFKKWNGASASRRRSR